MRASLQRTRDFRRVERAGRRARRDGIVVVAAPRPAGGPTRLGLAVRVREGAVMRNRAKRRLRAAFRACAPRPGFDVVLRGDGSAGRLEFQELVEKIAEALRATGVELEGRS